MESLSRQFHRKKLSNAKSNNSYGATYDGVFAGGGGGEPKFGAQPNASSRIEDYAEIFGGSRASSSIPILDVSALDGPKVSASKLDYSVIFGGCGDEDLGVSYEEMFAKPKECRNFYIGAKPPAKTFSHSDGSDQLNRNRVEAFQNDAANQSFEGVKQINMSYHKSSQRSNDGINGTTRVTQLSAVPGFTCFIEENPALQKPSPQKKDGDKYVPPPKVNVTSPPKVYANAAKTHSSDGTGKFESQSSSYNFYSVDKSFGANEPKTHSSKMSSPSSVAADLISNKSVPKRSIDSNSKVPKSDASRAGPGYGSPSFSDEELDANSVAAASAAALKKALETAQASIRIARDFMERKKDGTHRFSKPSSKDGVDINNRRENKVTIAQSRFTEKNAEEMSGCDDIVFQVLSRSEREKARRSGKVAPDLKQIEEISIIKEVVRDTNGNKLEPAKACGALRQMPAVENRGECRTATLSCERASIESVDTRECGRKEMETEKEILLQPDRSGKKVDEEARKLENLEVKLFTLAATRDLEQHIDRLDAAQEVQEKEDNEKRGVAQVDEETKEKQKASNAQEKSEEELEEFFEPKENEEFQSPGEKANNNEEGLHEGRECMENEKKLEDIFIEEQNEELSEEFFDLKENEEFESQEVKVNNNEEGHDEALGCLENQRKLEDICVEAENENLLEEFLDLKENEEFESQDVKANNNEGLDEPEGCMENERKLKDIFGEEQNEKLLDEFLDLKENEEFDCQGVKVNNNEEQHDEAQECMENEKKLEDIFDKEQNNKLLDDIHEEESGKELRETCEQNKVDKGLEASGLWAGYEGAVELESIEKKQHDAHEGDDKESFDKSHELDISDERFSDTSDGEESEEKQDDDSDLAVKESILVDEDEDTENIQRETEGNDKESFDKSHELDISDERFRDTSDGEESEEKQDDDSDLAVEESILVDEDEDTENIQRETEGNETMKVYQELVVEAMNLDATINAKSEAGESMSESEVHRDNQDDNDFYFEENQRISDVTESSGEFTLDEIGLEAAEMAQEVGEKENCNSGGLVGDATEHIEMENQMKDGSDSEALLFNHSPENIGLTDRSYEAKQPDQNGKESELTTSVGSGIKISACDSSVEGEKEVDEKTVVGDLDEVKSNFGSAHVRRVRKQWFETGKKIEPSQPPSVFEGEEKTIGIDEEIKTHPIIDEVAKGNLDTAHERRVRKQWFETGKKTEPSQPPSIFKGEDKTMRIDEEIKTNPITEKNVDNLAKTHTVEEKETKEMERKEVKKESLRKMDEANKREREREKDRMAVERAIREARERAFAEARERAERAAVERATAEVRKRVMAEAREKVDKAAATKSSAEKASMEAKLRTERAAVERATVEARERALEKALSQKPTSGAREHTERYVAEKVSGVSRESGMRQSFSSPDTKKLDESTSESAERRKARLERNQRTMERAAKALAEKNKRDLLAQKEQAERNRFAETLDAEVKRWSSGKEGNLRALLSTLQYVLGPNSGWQPVSLTEIITTSAVKKAYRKATLHVHPDKLQQRGATIQQKYICEKVFELLKAAWNKFNSEER